MSLLYSVYKWCNDNGYTPCLLLTWCANRRNANSNLSDHNSRLSVTTNIQSHTNGSSINSTNNTTDSTSTVINISKKAVRNLTIAINSMTLLASFRGQQKEITICTDDIISAYSLETGEGVLLCDYPLLNSFDITGHQRYNLSTILKA